jgi:porin
MLGDGFYMIGGLLDANSDPEDPFEGFDTFWDDSEFFKSIELGWTSSQERLVLDNAHVTLWHKDEQDRLGVADGWGINASVSRFYVAVGLRTEVHCWKNR